MAVAAVDKLAQEYGGLNWLDLVRSPGSQNMFLFANCLPTQTVKVSLMCQAARQQSKFRSKME